MSNSISTVAIIFAMRQEAQGIINSFDLKPVQNICTFSTVEIYGGQIAELNLIVGLNGTDSRFGVDRIGTEAATLTTYLVCEKFRPDLVISAGTAGGFLQDQTEIGDLFLSKDIVVYHDHRISLPKFEEFGVGSFPCLQLNYLPKLLNSKQAVVSSGNSLDCSEIDFLKIRSKAAMVKEMEAAAVAQIANDFGIPFFTLKSITDFVDGPHDNALEFLKNLELATSNLTQALFTLIKFLSSTKKIEEL